jgi:hypothetical protein
VARDTLAGTRKSTWEGWIRIMSTRIPEFSHSQGEELVRLYVQIRKDLEFKLLKLIYDAKINPTKREKLTRKKKVSKRTIVEEALEEYFERRGI